jgi:hypothetical protein
MYEMGAFQIRNETLKMWIRIIQSDFKLKSKSQKW